MGKLRLREDSPGKSPSKPGLLGGAHWLFQLLGGVVSKRTQHSKPSPHDEFQAGPSIEW